MRVILPPFPVPNVRLGRVASLTAKVEHRDDLAAVLGLDIVGWYVDSLGH